MAQKTALKPAYGGTVAAGDRRSGRCAVYGGCACWPDAGGSAIATSASREKPTFLVANKTDGIDADQAIADFWSLGLGESILSRRLIGGVPACWSTFCCRGLTMNPPEEVDEDAEYWAQFEAEENAKKKMKTTSTRRICRLSWRLWAVRT
jgi:hypothetical protein